MSEETKKADVAGAWGMIGAVVVSALTGWLFLVAFYFGIHDYSATLSSVTGFPMTQILLDNFSKELTLFFMCLILVACWFCGLASVTANSRMIYAFSRDHAMVSFLLIDRFRGIFILQVHQDSGIFLIHSSRGVNTIITEKPSIAGYGNFLYREIPQRFSSF